jgi:hypothetical protein
MSLRDFLIRWIFLSGVGMSVGFLTFLNFLFFLAFGLNFENYWSEEATEGVKNAEHLLRIGLAVGLPLAGAVFATTQSFALRRLGIRNWRWILAGPVGFLVPALIIWPITGIWGDIPGPVEPLTIVGGGLLGTAAVQWLMVGNGRKGLFKWLALWGLGLALGMLVYLASAFLSDSVRALYSENWAIEVGVIGFLAGSLAAATSGKTIFRSLSSKPSAAPRHAA